MKPSLFHLFLVRVQQCCLENIRRIFGKVENHSIEFWVISGDLGVKINEAKLKYNSMYTVFCKN